MSGADSIAVAVTFVWLGMVVAISFLEAPLKSRAPDVTLRIGLGIGRLVFRALNTAEALLATAVGVTLIVGAHPATVLVPTLTRLQCSSCSSSRCARGSSAAPTPSWPAVTRPDHTVTTSTSG